MVAQSNDIFVGPEDERVPLWRYMDFAKFVSILTEGGLYFARVDHLGDNFEGTHAKGVQPIDLSPPPQVDEAQLRDAIKKSRVLARQTSRELKTRIFVSSWYMSEHESAAMWKLYGFNEQAIALKTSFRKLKFQLPADVFLGMVRYIDYEKDFIPGGNFWFPFVHKRKSFEHEREVRAIFAYALNRVPETKIGEWRKVDLQTLIDGVYVAPTAPAWFQELVSSTSSKFGFAFQAHRSSLDQDPLW